MPPENDQAAAPDKDRKAKGSVPFKSIIILLAIMLLEGGGLTLYMAYSDPSGAGAGTVEGASGPARSSMGEVLVLEDRFTNMRTGRLYMYDVRICVEIDEDNLKSIEKKLGKRRAYVYDSIRIVFAQADPKYLEEPELQTMKRKVHEILEEVLGKDTVKQVLFAKYHPYRGQ